MINPEILSGIKDRFAGITREMSDPEIATDPRKMAALGREHTTLKEVVGHIDTYVGQIAEIKDLKDMVRSETDADLKEMAAAELEELQESLPALEEELRLMLIPKNPEDTKDAIIEIRAGTGGDEAALFAGDLFRLYGRVAEKKGWKVDLMESSPGTQGGFKEIIFGISGPDAFGSMKYESGVHRVQRVPATESSGRIHTSAATVAVLP